jgi:hypothetical protein
MDQFFKPKPNKHPSYYSFKAKLLLLTGILSFDDWSLASLGGLDPKKVFSLLVGISGSPLFLS